MLFNPHTEANKILTELFADNIEVLEKSYLVIAKIDTHEDYDGRTFASILELDPDFIYKYIDDIYARKEWVSRYDDTRDYSFIWKRDDWEDVVTKAINYIYAKEKERGAYIYSYVEVLFLSKNYKEKSYPTENQRELLHKLIVQRNDDSEFMQFLFGIIAQFAPESRFSFITLFLAHNNKIDDFKKLSLEPNSWCWSGSAIPMLQERITFYDQYYLCLNGRATSALAIYRATYYELNGELTKKRNSLPKTIDRPPTLNVRGAGAGLQTCISLIGYSPNFPSLIPRQKSLSRDTCYFSPCILRQISSAFLICPGMSLLHFS